MIILIVIVIVIFVVLSIVYFTLKNGISPMPSSSFARLVAMKEIKKYIEGTKDHLIVDVGSGWGTLAFQTARLFPSHKVIGLENSHIPLWISRLFRMWGAYSNLRFIRHHIYTYSYVQADIVLCYLYPGAMKQLSTIFRQQLNQDAYIISILFALPGWQPEKIIE